MAMAALRVFEFSGQVNYFDVDPRREMAPVAYWRVLQNAAAGHAAALSAATEDLRRGGQTWMLSRMKLVIDRTLKLGESYTVETWPSTRIKGARAFRDYVIKDSDGKICARASSLWVIVDLATRRPVRIPDTIAALSIDPGYAVPALLDSIPPVQAGEETAFRVCWSDADQNEHANNSAYVRWAVDSMPLSFLLSHRLVSLEAHYLSELAIGEVVNVCSSFGFEVIHELSRAETIAARLMSYWETCHR